MNGLIILGLVVLLGLAIRSVVKSRKRGGCCGGCSSCPYAGKCDQMPEADEPKQR